MTLHHTSTIVQTTGINWDNILAILVELVIVVGGVGAAFIRFAKHQIREVVDTTIKKEIIPVINRMEERLDRHDSAIAWLQGHSVGRHEYEWTKKNPPGS